MTQARSIRCRSASWSTSLGDFHDEGAVVVASTADVADAELLRAPGLLAVSSHTTLPDSTHLVVSAAADASVHRSSRVRGFGAPVSFQGVAAPSSDLAGWSDGKDGAERSADPVVVHRIVR